MLGIPDVVPEREPWMDDALCAQTDPDLFFPETKGGSHATEAKKVCRECPVREQCLAYALEHGELHGIWGGLSPKERARLGRAAA
jgi:WhiB family redox-sensing transcriptional regulator